MSQGAITRVWRNGEDTFCLAPIGQILDLEDKCRAGLGTIMSRLADANWYVGDVRHVIRLGLVGAGMDPAAAHRVVERHVVAPLAECVLLAYEIVSAVIVAPEGQQPGKPAADREMAPESGSTSQTADSPGSPAISSAPSSDGIPATSTAAPSGNSPPISTDTTKPTSRLPKSRRRRATRNTTP